MSVMCNTAAAVTHAVTSSRRQLHVWCDSCCSTAKAACSFSCMLMIVTMKFKMHKVLVWFY
jgi:hypothetical protein